MLYTHSGPVDAPIDDVFAWHRRPGAIERLAPPWQAVRILAEAESLRDGSAVLGMPGGLRWVARHDPDGYDPPHQFVDVLASAPLRPLLRWRHTHRFEPEGEARTRVTDRVESRLPEAMLRPMFAYRHRQLADDLVAHRRGYASAASSLTVAITDPAGQVGAQLAAFLSTGGHRVVRLVRHRPRTSEERHWEPDRPSADLLDGVDAVVHLAGGSGVTSLAELAARSDPAILVVGSSIDYYGRPPGGAPVTESGPAGTDPLAEAAAALESSAAAVDGHGLRVVRVRAGTVLSPRVDPLRRLRRLTAAGLRPAPGVPAARDSWIGIDDLVEVYHRAVVDPRLRGPVNAVTPDPADAETYTETLARVLHRPITLVVPRPVRRRARDGVVAAPGPRILPERLAVLDHRFRHPTLEGVLRHVLGRYSGDETAP